jgi:hypothetical protein
MYFSDKNIFLYLEKTLANCSASGVPSCRFSDLLDWSEVEIVEKLGPSVAGYVQLFYSRK